MSKQFTQDLQKAILILWVLSGILSLAGLLALIGLNENVILGFSYFLSDHHEHECILCGVTKGCLSLTKGNISDALTSNPISVLFTLLLVSNSFLFILFSLNKLSKLNNSNKYEYS